MAPDSRINGYRFNSHIQLLSITAEALQANSDICDTMTRIGIGIGRKGRCFRQNCNIGRRWGPPPISSFVSQSFRLLAQLTPPWQGTR